MVLLALLFLFTAGLGACPETPEEAAARKQRESSIWSDGFAVGNARAAAIEQELSRTREELQQVREVLQQAIAERNQAKIDAEERIRKELKRTFPGSPPPFEGWRGTVYKGMVMMGAGELLLTLLFACGFLIFNHSTVRERVGTAMATVLGAVVAVWLSGGFWKMIESSQAVLLAPANRFRLDWLVVGSFFATVTFLVNAYFFRAFVIHQRRGSSSALGAFVVGAMATAYVLTMPMVLRPKEPLGTEITQHLASHVFLGVLIGGTVHLIWVFITHRGPLLRHRKPRVYSQGSRTASVG
jgi:hypothetical protein